jgi:hypothetical protein
VARKFLAPLSPKSFRIWPSGEKNRHGLDEFLSSPWKKARPEKSFHQGATWFDWLTTSGISNPRILSLVEGGVLGASAVMSLFFN